MMTRKVLVLEDEENIRSFVVINLKRAGYEVIQAGSGEEALDRFHENPDVAVCIFDVMLPGIDGYEVCRILRAEGYEGGIIMLTARTQEADKVTGLMTGADDYVTKPFSVVELTARVDALVRRLGLHSFAAETIQSGVFCLDMRARELKKNGRHIDLTQVEFALMKTFLENRGRAMDREELLGAVWGKNYSGELKIVDVNIRRLRIKVEDDPASPKHITTVRGFGYMWKD